MNFVPRLGSVMGGAAALCLSFGLEPASAGPNCAAYGPEFTNVEGTETCIRIGGHVRVESSIGSTTSSVNNGWASGSARPASLFTNSDSHSGGLDLSRSHLRLRQVTMGYADPIH